MSKHRKVKRSAQHVRLYGWELKMPAYRCLSTDARALLVEYRSLYSGTRNRVYLSVRDTMERLGIGQRRAQRARKELEDHGWLRVMENSIFSSRGRMATVHALTNEPLEDREGAVAPMDYMRWQPRCFAEAPPESVSATTQKRLTACKVPTHRKQDSYSHIGAPLKTGPDRMQGAFGQTQKLRPTVGKEATQISYQAERSDVSWWRAITVTGLAPAEQVKLLVWWLLTLPRPGVWA